MACKMATGSGKTAVMSMIIAWHTLNKLANPQGARFTDTVLVVTPGITIKDRLRVLLPSDPQNYYKGLEIVPSDLRDEMGKAKILITNYHAFLRREKIAAGKLTKAILNEGGGESAFTESEARWFAACAGSWAARRTSSCSTTRRTTVTGVAPAPRKSRS
jgi:type III restriction enzyme